MEKTIHFLGGCPRAGSTILCNILAQNPRFHSTHTSGCLDILFSIRNNWNRLIEHQAHPDDDGLRRVLKASFDAYHATKDRPVTFDKSRGWVAHLEMAEEILGRKAKVLVPVRNITDILASFEKLYRETAKIKQPPFEAENYVLFQTVEGRCSFWTQADQVVGLAFNRVSDVVKRGFRDRLHFVDFDKLTSDPYHTLKGIYDFLEEKFFCHDFNNVEQVTHEDDTVHGYVNLHKIQQKVEPHPSRAKEILGEEVYNHYNQIQLGCFNGSTNTNAT
jgi:sulfotransferase